MNPGEDLSDEDLEEIFKTEAMKVIENGLKILNMPLGLARKREKDV
jgi:hypothetical protein